MTFFKNKLSLFLICVTSLGLIACTEDGNDRRFISEHNGSADPVMLQAKGARTATFYVKKISAANPQVLEYNELGFPRVKEYDISVCLADKATLGALYGRPFIVSDGVTDRTLTSDDGGCLRWKETYEFDYFEPEKFIKFTRTIKGRNGIRGAVELEIALNPWTNDFYDLRYNPVATVPNSFVNTPFNGQLKPAMAVGPDEKARIKQDSILLNYIGHDADNYQIDENLNLTLAYKYFLEFNPTIFRRAINPQYKAESATDGKVRLAVIFLRESRTNPELDNFNNYIQHFEGVFDIEMGRIREPFTLKVSKLDDVDVRFRTLVVVEPVVTSSNVKPAYFEGYVGPLPAKSALQLVPTDKYNVDQILAGFKQKLAQIPQMSPYERLLSTQPHRIGSLESLVQSAIANDRTGLATPRTIEELNKLIHTYDSPEELEGGASSLLVNEICRVYLGKDYSSCLTFWHMFNIRYLRLVENVTSKPTKVGLTIPEGIKFNVSSTSSNTRAGKLGADLNIGLGFGLSSPFGGVQSPITASLGGSIGYGISQSVSWARSRGYAVYSETSFLVDKLLFKFNAEVRGCILVEPRPEYTREMIEKRPSLFCREEIEEREVMEPYFYIRKATTGSEGTTDTNSASENPIRMVIRGQAQYDQFLQQMKRRGHTLVFFEPENWDEQGASLLLFQGMSQEFPGLLSE